MKQLYTSPLTISSQFFFCGLPLRLDSYKGCGFQCGFCFARARAGSNGKENILAGDPEYLSRVLRAHLQRDGNNGLIGQFIRRRTPIHFGGMSDPFQSAEAKYKVTLAYLKALAAFEYPTVISTRGTMLASEPYLSLIQQMRAVVIQFSMTTTDDHQSAAMEPHSPLPSERMKAMEVLSKSGVPVMCRWQPFLPGGSEKPETYVRRVAATGARHLALEHLKVPMELRNPKWQEFSTATQTDWKEFYKTLGSRRDAREYMLPLTEKLHTVNQVARLTRSAGMTFGAADNDLQYLSDTCCCCSGVDAVEGFENWYKHQVGYAVRKTRNELIRYREIAPEWVPSGSVDRYLNSHCRLSSRGKAGGSISDHLKERWNDVRSNANPSVFFGIDPSDEFCESGYRIYKWNRSGLALRKLLGVKI